MQNIIIERLSDAHETNTFRCKEDTLNKYLHTNALNNQKAGLGTTYLLLDADIKQIIGYFTYSSAQIEREELPEERQYKWLPRYPIPAWRIGRLAIDEKYLGKGLGKMLLLRALVHLQEIAESHTGLLVIVDALHEEAKAFYLKLGFRETKSKPLQLFISFKDIKKSLS